MQSVDQSPTATAKTPVTARSVLRPPVVGVQHRIYVWSCPSPYAMVVDEARSFQPK